MTSKRARTGQKKKLGDCKRHRAERKTPPPEGRPVAGAKETPPPGAPSARGDCAQGKLALSSATPRSTMAGTSAPGCCEEGRAIARNPDPTQKLLSCYLLGHPEGLQPLQIVVEPEEWVLGVHSAQPSQHLAS